MRPETDFLQTHEQEEEGKTVLLSFDEVRILLYSLGFTSCEGIHMPEKEFSPQEILQAMHAMSRRGLLVANDAQDGPQFTIRSDLLQMLSAMGNPGGTMIYRQGETLPGFSPELNNGREFFCYIIPDYILVTERDWTRREYLRLRAMSPEAFAEWKEAREREAEEEGVEKLVSGRRSKTQL